MSDIDISVNLCTYNRAGYLAEALASLVGQRTHGAFTYEVVVVDNASTDETPRVVERVAATSDVPVRYVRETQRGIAAARNRAVAESRGEWIAIFDDDQLADPEWLAELLTAANELKCDCVGGSRLLILPKDETRELEPVCRTMLGELRGGSGYTQYRGKYYPCDANVIRRRSLHARFGEFDTSMFRGGQDQELSRRLQEAGISMWHAPRAVVHHRVERHMLTDEYFRWHAMRSGTNYAYQDFKHSGRWAVIAKSAARVGQAFVRSGPALVVGRITGRPPAMVARCRWWRMLGYARNAAHLCLPRWLSQEGFLKGLDFRATRRGSRAASS